MIGTSSFWLKKNRGRQSEKEDTLTGPICRLLIFFVVLVMILRS